MTPEPGSVLQYDVATRTVTDTFVSSAESNDLNPTMLALMRRKK